MDGTCLKPPELCILPDDVYKIVVNGDCMLERVGMHDFMEIL